MPLHADIRSHSTEEFIVNHYETMQYVWYTNTLPLTRANGFLSLSVNLYKQQQQQNKNMIK